MTWDAASRTPLLPISPSRDPECSRVADGVAGSMGHDQGPDNHEGAEAEQRHDLVGGVGLEAAVGNSEDDRKDQADDLDRQH
jgi:hypothetical protein